MKINSLHLVLFGHKRNEKVHCILVFSTLLKCEKGIYKTARRILKS